MRAVVAAFVVATLLGCSGAAGAGTGDQSFDVATSGDGDTTEVSFGVNASFDGSDFGPLGSNPLVDCVLIGGLSGLEVTEYAGGKGILLEVILPDVASSDSTYVFMSCADRVLGGFNWTVWEEGDSPPPEVIEALAVAARNSITIPALTPESAPDGLDTPFLTQLPVWLWVPEASWAPVSGTAALPEIGLSITATATPVETEWLTGAEGDATIVCDAGTPWQPGLDDSETDCAVTYGDTTAPGVTFDLSVTTTFDIGFTCTPGLCDPADIDLPGFTVTVARPVTVTEARGVISR